MRTAFLRLPRLLPGLLLLLALAAGPVQAAESEGWGYRLAHDLMSPFCPGRTLAACPSDKAAELRQWILLQEAAGASREEVVAILEQRFGDVIHSSPEAEGWGLAAWLLPVTALLAGALVVAWVLRRMTRGADAGPAESAGMAGAPRSLAEDAELEQLVDEEFRRAELGA